MASLSEIPFIQRFLEKLSESREFAISAILHVILVIFFGTAVLFEAVKEPPDFEGEGEGFVSSGGEAVAPPQQADITPQETTFEVQTITPTPATQLTAITTTASNPLSFEISSMIMPTQSMAPQTAATAAPAVAPKPSGGGIGDGITPQIAGQIKAFAGGWGKGTGTGVGIRQREFEFSVFLAEYTGGNWNSTVEVQMDGGTKKVVKGSLPNLLDIINQWSRDKIKTNFRNIRVIRLDSDEIFAIKPPFIFMTGSRDFKLSDKEVENLRKYVRMGGCVWGDSSVPGRNSRFDIAFRREMRRVIPDVDKDFEPLPKDHPIFTQGYFQEIKEVPPGINFYQEPVYALKIYGEIGILYTANDYADMWQIGITKEGFVDLSETGHGDFAVTNKTLWNLRHTYIGNIEPTAPGRSGGASLAPASGGAANAVVAQNLVDAYKFGTNVIVHLLTRWDRVIARAPSL